MSRNEVVLIETRNEEGTSNEILYEFRECITNVKGVKFKSIQLYNSFYNISTLLVNYRILITSVLSNRPGTRNDFVYTFKDGFYDVKGIEKVFNEALNSSQAPEDIRGKVELIFSYDQNTNGVSIVLKMNSELEFNLTDFRITSNALKLLGFKDSMVPLPATSDIGVKLNPFTKFYVHCDLVGSTKYKKKGGHLVCILPVKKKEKWWDPVIYKGIDTTFKPYQTDFNQLRIWITDEKGDQINFNGYPILYEIEITEY